MTGPLSDQKLQKQMRAEERRLSTIEADDLRWLMAHEQGRRFYYRIAFLMTGLESSSYATSGQYMAYLEGRRSVAINLRDEAQKVCSREWIQMISERIDMAARDGDRTRWYAEKEEN